MTCGPQRGPATLARIQAQVKQATREMNDVELGSVKRKFALIAQENEKLRNEVADWRDFFPDHKHCPKSRMIVHRGAIAEAMQDDGIG